MMEAKGGGRGSGGEQRRKAKERYIKMSAYRVSSILSAQGQPDLPWSILEAKLSLGLCEGTVLTSERPTDWGGGLYLCPKGPCHSFPILRKNFT